MSTASDLDVGDGYLDVGIGGYTDGRPRQTFLNRKLMVPSWQQCLMSGSWLHDPIDLPQANCGQMRLCYDSLHLLFANLQLNGHLYPKLTRIIHWTTHAHLYQFQLKPTEVPTSIYQHKNCIRPPSHQKAYQFVPKELTSAKLNKRSTTLYVSLFLYVSLYVSLSLYILACIAVGVYYTLVSGL